MARGAGPADGGTRFVPWQAASDRTARADAATTRPVMETSGGGAPARLPRQIGRSGRGYSPTLLSDVAGSRGGPMARPWLRAAALAAFCVLPAAGVAAR